MAPKFACVAALLLLVASAGAKEEAAFPLPIIGVATAYPTLAYSPPAAYYSPPKPYSSPAAPPNYYYSPSAYSPAPYARTLRRSMMGLPPAPSAMS